MSPRIERTAPPYMQVTDHFRKQIQDGVLSEGDRLPAVAEIAREWDIAHATAAKAISQLQVEGLILTSPRGSFVASQGGTAASPHDRLMRYWATGTLASGTEQHRVTEAEVVQAPAYVAELFGLEPGEQVIRRQWVTVENKSLRALTVAWHHGNLAEVAPDLLSTNQSSIGTRLREIEAVTGPVTHGRDFAHSRGADAREASALGLPNGTAIQALTWLWTAQSGQDTRLVEYGESVLPPRHTLSYDYAKPSE